MARRNDWLHIEMSSDVYTGFEVARAYFRCRDGYVKLLDLRTGYNPVNQVLDVSREDAYRQIMELAAKELAIIALEREDGHTKGAS